MFLRVMSVKLRLVSTFPITKRATQILEVTFSSMLLKFVRKNGIIVTVSAAVSGQVLLGVSAAGLEVSI